MRSKSILKEKKDNMICLSLSDKQYNWLSEISKSYNCNVQMMIRIIIEDCILTDHAMKEI